MMYSNNKQDVLARLLVESLRYADVWVKVKGGSMAPCLKDGMLVLVSSPERIFCSDILVYHYEGGIIIHRLMRRYRKDGGSALYQTKADNGYALDEPVSLEDICGKVVALKSGSDIIRLDSFWGRIRATCSYLASLSKLVFHKYVKA
ncbi:MAG: S24/S26 family peptidase [Candidatus Omnitrophota bacterium]|nr:S24/S26 family peptidase [Candidatus Omnitrophota bacterium]